MKYYLKIQSFQGVTEDIISQKQYLEFKEAQGILFNALEIEEKFEMVISNYLRLEKMILTITAERVVRSNPDYPAFFEARSNLNLCMVNLLSAARLYVDQIPQNVHECLSKKQEIVHAVKELLSREYDRNKDYRFMEALRNHVQHAGIPVHLITHGARRQEAHDISVLEYTLDFYSLSSHLKENKKLKKSVLEDFGEKIDLKDVTRGYIESLSSVHDEVRNLIHEPVQKARGIIKELIEKYESSTSYEIVLISACEKDNKGNIDSVSLFLDYDEIRIRLINRNKKLSNLKKRFVSNLSKPDGN